MEMVMENTQKRIVWIDSAKGWGMIFVMLGHAGSPLAPLLYVFHIPLFFFLSGYLFNKQKHKSLLSTIQSKWRTLLIPYFSFATFNYVLWLVLNRNILFSGWGGILKPLAGAIIAIRHTDWTPHIGTFWFISCLFVTELLWCFLLKITNERFKTLRFLLVGCLAAFGFYYAVLPREPLPWSFDAALVALLFFLGGHATKAYSKQLQLPVRKIYLILAAILGVACGVLNGFYANADYHHVDMFYSRYGNPLLFIVGAFSGIYLVVLAVQKLPELSAIQFIGRYSIVYLCFHQFPLYDLMARIHLHRNTKQASAYSTISAFSSMGTKYYEIFFLVCKKFISSTVLVLVACALITMLVLLLKRFAPWTLGRKTEVVQVLGKRVAFPN